MRFAAELIKYTAAALLLCPQLLQADAFGLIGGGQGNNAYAALVSSTAGVTPLTVPTGGAKVDTVAMNTLGFGIIGGNQNGMNDAYAALVSPSGTVFSLTVPTGGASINDVAINVLGNGLIGGFQPGSGYAALVFPAGAIAPLTLPGGIALINAVAINDSGNGLLGGSTQLIGGNSYASQVSPSGHLTTLTTPGAGSSIVSVAINASGSGLIGGTQNAFNDAYAAQITPSGAVTSLLLPTGGANIFQVAINASGMGLIGGRQNGLADAYAAQISPSGVVTPLSVPTGGAGIFAVSINASGVGLIGGEQNGKNDAYAALVSPSGIVTPLSVPKGGAVIFSTAINDFGAGLIGGEQNNFTAAYAALITPTGGIIPLSLPANSFLNGVAVSLLSQITTTGLTGNNRIFANYINKNAPQDAFYFLPAFFDGTLAEALQSAVPTRNAISLYTASNNLFYLNHSLSNHLRNASHFRNRGSSNKSAKVAVGPAGLQTDELMASLAGDEIAWQHRAARKKTLPPLTNRPYTLWVEGIGALSYQKAQKQTVGFNPSTGAALFGFDAVINPKSWVGGGAAYTYTQIHERKNAGHSHINQEYLFVYGSYLASRFYVDGAFWGGLFQIDQTRNIRMTGFNFRSKSNPHGWQLSPHLELGYSVTNKNKLIVDPFLMVDWVNAWQHRYKEKGRSPFNAGQKEHYSSLLRSELGVRFFETVTFDAWRLTFQEKGSYVNIHPFLVGRVNAFLVGSPGSFTVETLTSSQNLGVAEFGMIFEPIDQRYPYGVINYQGEFSESYQSHQASIELGWNF